MKDIVDLVSATRDRIEIGVSATYGGLLMATARVGREEYERAWRNGDTGASITAEVLRSLDLTGKLPPDWRPVKERQ